MAAKQTLIESDGVLIFIDNVPDKRELKFTVTNTTFSHISVWVSFTDLRGLELKRGVTYFISDIGAKSSMLIAKFSTTQDEINYNIDSNLHQKLKTISNEDEERLSGNECEDSSEQGPEAFERDTDNESSDKSSELAADLASDEESSDISENDHAAADQESSDSEEGPYYFKAPSPPQRYQITESSDSDSDY
mmetsp:Transcript_30040/g.53271  ORF Transcript_30040/g.53271 Transcript_30040/m.53271 type:complete len:192 (-) Transcript_30040:136-711(-)